MHDLAEFELIQDVAFAGTSLHDSQLPNHFSVSTPRGWWNSQPGRWLKCKDQKCEYSFGNRISQFKIELFKTWLEPSASNIFCKFGKALGSDAQREAREANLPQLLQA